MEENDIDRLKGLLVEILPDKILKSVRTELNHLNHIDRELWSMMKLNDLAELINETGYLKIPIFINKEDYFYTFITYLTHLFDKLNPGSGIDGLNVNLSDESILVNSAPCLVIPKIKEIEIIAIMMRRLIELSHYEDIYIKSDISKKERSRMIEMIDNIESKIRNTPEIFFDIRCIRRGLYCLTTIKEDIDPAIFKATDIMYDLNTVTLSTLSGSPDFGEMENVTRKSGSLVFFLYQRNLKKKKGNFYKTVMMINSYTRLALQDLEYEDLTLFNYRLEMILYLTYSTNDWIVKYSGLSSLFNLVSKISQEMINNSIILQDLIFKKHHFKKYSIKKSKILPSFFELIEHYSPNEINYNFKKVRKQWRINDLACRLLTHLYFNDNIAHDIKIKSCELMKDFDNLVAKNINLSNYDFSYASLKNANFENSNLKNANFYKANCIGCNFTNANIENANFQDTIFEDRELAKAKNIDLAIL